MAIDQEQVLRIADAIDPFTRKNAPDHLTTGVAAKLLRELLGLVPTSLVPISVPVQEDCDDCDGTGDMFGGFACEQCDGTGKVQSNAIRPLPESVLDAAFYQKDHEGNNVTGGCNMEGFKRAVRWAERKHNIVEDQT